MSQPFYFSSSHPRLITYPTKTPSLDGFRSFGRCQKLTQGRSTAPSAAWMVTLHIRLASFKVNK